MRKIRYGVVGVKGIGSLHCRYAFEHERVDLKALADKDEEAVKQCAHMFKTAYFTDYRKMLAADLVDAVSIATPHHLHYSMGLDCLKGGVHVFIEKPIATCVSEADQLVRVADEKSLKICVGHQYRLHRTSKTMKKLIDSGSIGSVMRVLWSWGVFRPEVYFFHPEWHRIWGQAGGGILMTHAVHDLDLMCWMFGKPKQVCAMLRNQLHDIHGEDMVAATILFANGALASFQATVNQPEAYSIRQASGDRGIIVIQNLKSMTYDHKDRILLGRYKDRLQSAVVKLPGKLDQPAIAWQTVKPVDDPPVWKKLIERLGFMKIERRHGLSDLMDSFVRAILNGGQPMVSGKSAAVTLELANAMVLSAVRNKPVELPVDRDEYDALFKELCCGETKISRYRDYKVGR
jgi:predicted dehydrogenase